LNNGAVAEWLCTGLQIRLILESINLIHKAAQLDESSKSDGLISAQENAFRNIQKLYSDNAVRFLRMKKKLL